MGAGVGSCMRSQDGVRLVVQLLDCPWERTGERMPEGSVAVLASAAEAVNEVSRSNSAIQQTVVECSGIALLATLMTSSATREEVKAEVAGALWALSEDSRIKVDIANAKNIAPLVQLLGSGDERAHHHASGALLSLGLDNRTNQVQWSMHVAHGMPSNTARVPWLPSQRSQRP